ncbi:TetR/AcrR family transcriptional regulator [Massilia sp. 9096]|uniref:TetR/AcrR family transcriptional regulator n=1 Tax=Massilia sp. 9096 TaxID=1500894 RepID=UPI00068B7752|nr:TetR/AcrR family transcriptional regulator [Massilia sp. 9096]
MKLKQVQHEPVHIETQSLSVQQREGGGRPRDATRDEAILEAAIAILSEVGYERMTMDMVAVRAKAGKATVYRRWPSKGEMVVEAVGRMKRSLIDLDQLPDTGTLRGDLLALFRPQSVEQAEQKMRAMAGVAAMLAQHPALAEAGHDAIVAPWVAANRILIERACARGEANANAQIDTVAQIIPSLAAYRALIQRRPFDYAFLAEIIDGVVLPALGIATPLIKEEI